MRSGTVEPVEQYFQYSLLGLLASGYFALAGSGTLDPITLAVTGLGLLLRLLMVTGVFRLQISGRMLAAVTLTYIGFYPLDVLYISREFIPATVHLICFLAVVRILTATSRRDYFFVKVIAFLELLAATLLPASLTFFVFMTLFLIFGVATFCCSEMRIASQLPGQQLIRLPAVATGERFARGLSGLTAAIAVGIVLMTSALFFVLPRTARAAFRSIVSERFHLPGFSNEVTLGQIGELKMQQTPVMHVRIEAPHQRLGLKWRGAALSQFDGRRWYNPPIALTRVRLAVGPTTLVPDGQRRRPGPRISYEVRIGPVDSDALFFAGIPEFLQMDGLRFVYRDSGDSYRTGLGTAEGRVYRAIGHRPELLPPGTANADAIALTADERNEHLLLPGNTDPRILALAREKAVGADPREQAANLEYYLQTAFSYTTDLPKDRVEDPLANFLFDRRKGHCEYFSSAMAVMLRAVHIPSRVATGFQSGTFNPLTGWHLIRASDAHSWVEAWLPGRGWVAFDPTPPDLRVPQAGAALWAKLLLYVDAADTFWRDWVVNYSLDEQVDLMSRVERRSRMMQSTFTFNTDLREWMDQTGTRVKPWLSWGGIVVVIGFALWILGPRFWEQLTARRQGARIASGKAVASDAAILYGRMLRTLKRRGVEKPAWLTPQEFARIVPAPSRDADLVAGITSAYHELRYAGRTEAGPRMIRLIEQLETSPR